jgi:hypothetical protein
VRRYRLAEHLHHDHDARSLVDVSDVSLYAPERPAGNADKLAASGNTWRCQLGALGYQPEGIDHVIGDRLGNLSEPQNLNDAGGGDDRAALGVHESREGVARENGWVKNDGTAKALGLDLVAGYQPRNIPVIEGALNEVLEVRPKVKCIPPGDASALSLPSGPVFQTRSDLASAGPAEGYRHRQRGSRRGGRSRRCGRGVGLR